MPQICADGIEVENRLRVDDSGVVDVEVENAVLVDRHRTLGTAQLLILIRVCVNANVRLERAPAHRRGGNR